MNIYEKIKLSDKNLKNLKLKNFLPILFLKAFHVTLYHSHWDYFQYLLTNKSLI